MDYEEAGRKDDPKLSSVYTKARSNSFTLSELFNQASMFLSTPVIIRIVGRGEAGCMTWTQDVPISRIKPDFDGNGVVLFVEDSDIQGSRTKG
jgi:hypothetical protein